jgi:hypothetical protein
MTCLRILPDNSYGTGSMNSHCEFTLSCEDLSDLWEVFIKIEMGGGYVRVPLAALAENVGN